MSKLEALIGQFKKATQRFSEVLAVKKTTIVRDSAIQRFEFTFDLSWKAIKTWLEEKKGVICNSPKECFREAYRQKLIDYDKVWIKMTDWRNASVHTYKEELAESLYAELPKALEHFQQLLENLKGKNS